MKHNQRTHNEGTKKGHPTTLNNVTNSSPMLIYITIVGPHRVELRTMSKLSTEPLYTCKIYQTTEATQDIIPSMTTLQHHCSQFIHVHLVISSHICETLEGTTTKSIDLSQNLSVIFREHLSDNLLACLPLNRLGMLVSFQ